MTVRRQFAACAAKALGLALLLSCRLTAQIAPAGVNSDQSLVFAGLRSTNAKGAFRAVATDAAGDLYLLYDQQDGVRLLKITSDGATVLEQTLLGAAGDSGVALTLDPAGDLYVAGTSASGTLSATPGAAMIAPGSAFLAKFDPSLNEIFLTFTGQNKASPTAVAATADAVFVTGNTDAADLPATPGVWQPTAAANTPQDGFVERFSGDGSTLVYATYVSGADGSTGPTGIAADAADDVWLVGFTSSSAFPTLAAFVPVIESNSAGFVLRLTPAGDAVSFSTFVPGSGLNAVALDSTGTSLLVSGNVALGQFPVNTVTTPLLPAAPYQVLLRMALDGSSVQSGTVIAPGLQSTLVPTANGGAWIAGEFDADLPPLLQQPAIGSMGTAYAARITSVAGIDQSVRLGGLPNGNQTYASLNLDLASVVVDPAGELVAAGYLAPAASASLLAKQIYDLVLRSAPTPALPSLVADAQVTPALCAESSCAGSAAFLAKVESVSALPALAFSVDDTPAIVLRNLGSTAATGLQVSTLTGSYTTDCPSSLATGAECHVLLSGGEAGAVTATASNASAETVAYPGYSAPDSTLVFSPKELDFGIQTSTSPPAARTITVTNLGSAAQTFASGVATLPGVPSPYYELASTCPLASSTTKTLSAGAACTITVGFAAFANQANDGSQSAEWSLGNRQVLLTGYSQAGSLSLSSEEVDFGTQISGGLKLPRFLYLSNASALPIAHGPASLPASSPFTVTDLCPSNLAPASVCQLRVDYASLSAPSSDSISLTLDQGLVVLITGSTSVAAASAPTGSGLAATPSSVTFVKPVVVTGVSSEVQTVAITNNGSSATSPTISVAGDFALTGSCGAMLAPAATCAVALQFVPSQPGQRQGLLTIGDPAGATSVPITATASDILPSNNGMLSFPGTPVDQPVVQFYKISQPFSTLNATTTAPFRITLVEDTGFGPGQPPATAYVTSISSPCLNCWLALRFEPTAAGAQSGTLTLSSDPAGASYQLLLTGAGIAVTGLAASPSVADFGSVPAGSSSGSTTLTMTNLTTGTISLGTPTITGDFNITSSTCQASLGQGASCLVLVAFAPTATGARTGTLTLTSSTNSAPVALSGTGTPAATISVVPLGLVFTPSAPVQTVRLTNNGLSAVQIGALTASNASFSATSACASMPGGTSCTIQVTYTPGAIQVSGTLSIPLTSTDSRGGLSTTNQSVALSADYSAATAALLVTPALTSFGAIATGLEGPSRQFTIANLSAQTLTLGISMPRQFILTDAPCTSLAAGASCTFAAEFDPLTNGDIPGSITISGVSADGSVRGSAIAYTDGFGVGTGTLEISGGLIVEGGFDFGQVASGQSAVHTFTLANDGTGGSPAITIRRVTSLPPFLSTTTCAAALTPGSACTVTVTYAPLSHALGGSTDMGSLTIESDAQSSPNLINLTGVASMSPASGVAPLASYTLTQGSLAFGATSVGGASAPQTTTFTNTGNVLIQLAAAETTSDFSVQSTCSLVAPGASCPITVTSTPQTAGAHLAALQISSNAATSLDFVSLASAGAESPLAVSPSALDFGPVQVGLSTTLPVTLTNSSNVAVSIMAITTSGDYAASGNCPAAGASLAPFASCTVQVAFSPLATGTLSGQLEIVSSASNSPLAVSLTGIGTLGNLVVSPAALAFGTVAVGASATLPLLLTNNGSASITAIAFAPPFDYAVSSLCPGGTLAPGSTCTVQVTFSPTIIGTDNGTLAVTTGSPSALTSVPLTGTGSISQTSPPLTPAFTMTINGATTASLSVISGGSASAVVTASPVNGFVGDVALSCVPLSALPFATCSVSPAEVDLSAGQENAGVEITTGTNTASVESKDGPWLFCALVSAVLFFRRKRRAFASLALGVTVLLGGCGSKYIEVQKTSPTSTPPGTYLFEITGTSVANPATTRAVLVTLTVTDQ